LPPVADFKVQLTASRFQLNATQLRRNQNSEWVPEEHTQGRLVRVVLPQNFDERHFRVFSMAPYIPGAGSDEVLFQDRDVPESAIYNSRAENTMRKATRVSGLVVGALIAAALSACAIAAHAIVRTTNRSRDAIPAA
jgi:hypothetical protein